MLSFLKLIARISQVPVRMNQFINYLILKLFIVILLLIFSKSQLKFSNNSIHKKKKRIFMPSLSIRNFNSNLKLELKQCAINSKRADEYKDSDSTNIV